MFISVMTEDGRVSKLYVKKHDTYNDIVLRACRELDLNPDEYYILRGKDTMNLKKMVMSEYFDSTDYFMLRRGYRNYASQNVIVSLEFGDVSLEGIFKTTDNLWTVVNKLYTVKQFGGEEPILQYGGRIFSGVDELSSVTLQELNAVDGDRIQLKYGPKTNGDDSNVDIFGRSKRRSTGYSSD